MAQGMTIEASATLAIRDPARGSVIAELPVADAGDVATAVSRARAAQPGWAALSVRERGEALRRARRKLVRARAEVLDRLERETGKTRWDVVGELMGVCLDLGYLVRRAPRWLATERVSARPLMGKRALVAFNPRGVVGIRTLPSTWRWATPSPRCSPATRWSSSRRSWRPSGSSARSRRCSRRCRRTSSRW
jgi:acyl-CoA reductase-like NAD-dependent aldehyde dehydrogenase